MLLLVLVSNVFSTTYPMDFLKDVININGVDTVLHSYFFLKTSTPEPFSEVETPLLSIYGDTVESVTKDLMEIFLLDNEVKTDLSCPDISTSLNSTIDSKNCETNRKRSNSFESTVECKRVCGRANSSTIETGVDESSGLLSETQPPIESRSSDDMCHSTGLDFINFIYDYRLKINKSNGFKAPKNVQSTEKSKLCLYTFDFVETYYSFLKGILETCLNVTQKTASSVSLKKFSRSTKTYNEILSKISYMSRIVRGSSVYLKGLSVLNTNEFYYKIMKYVDNDKTSESADYKQTLKLKYSAGNLEDLEKFLFEFIKDLPETFSTLLINQSFVMIISTTSEEHRFKKLVNLLKLLKYDFLDYEEQPFPSQTVYTLFLNSLASLMTNHENYDVARVTILVADKMYEAEKASYDGLLSKEKGTEMVRLIGFFVIFSSNNFKLGDIKNIETLFTKYPIIGQLCESSLDLVIRNWYNK